MMEELKPCPFCKCIEKTLSNAICSFGKEFPDDRPEGAMSFWLRYSANGYELHAEAISIDDDGNECCEYDGNAEINFCPICGKPLNRRAKAVKSDTKTDYELIKELRSHGLSDGSSLGWHMEIMDEAADRLEELNRRAEPGNKPLTNADCIRSMSDEELTRFIQGDLPIFRTFGEQLNWLKQPAKEDK